MDYKSVLLRILMDSPLATGNGSGAGDVGEYAIGTYDQ